MSHGRPTRSSSSFHFLAGASSGVVTAVLLQPADLLKTRLQQARATTLLPTFRAICAGPAPIRTLWRGTLPSALRTGFGSALYFSALNAARQYAGAVLPRASRQPLAGSSVLPPLPPLANLTAGALARAAAGLVLMPVTVLKVRFESDLYAYRSLWGATRHVLRTEGLRGFFAGWGVTAARDAPYAGLYVLFYEAGKMRLAGLVQQPGAPRTTTTVEEEKGDTEGERRGDMSAGAATAVNFASGILAAGLATALTNPFDAVKTRLQLMPRRYGNMARAARTMLREEGTRSLFDGLGLRIARKGMSSALAWTAYEEMVRRAEVNWRERSIL